MTYQCIYRQNYQACKTNEGDIKFLLFLLTDKKSELLVCKKFVISFSYTIVYSIMLTDAPR
jgi:hypothetical protein